MDYNKIVGTSADCGRSVGAKPRHRHVIRNARPQEPVGRNGLGQAEEDSVGILGMLGG